MTFSTIETDVETGRLVEVKVTLPTETVAEQGITVGATLTYSGTAGGTGCEVEVVAIRDHPLGSEITARPKRSGPWPVPTGPWPGVHELADLANRRVQA